MTHRLAGMPPDAVETAVSVLFPAADPVVGGWRARYDPSMSWGVGAHVTAVYPWAPPDDIDARIVAELRALIGAIPATTCRLESIGWFGDRVVWAAPQPVGWFRALTAAIVDRWMEWPPYGGAFADAVPHLTIGQDAARETLAAAAEDVARQLPIVAPIRRVQLLAGSPRPKGWRVVQEFDLAPAGHDG